MAEAPPLVLVVEDDAVVRRVLEVNLRLAGFETLTASSGGGALDAARSRAPDAIALDLGLPDLDGWQVLERLRAVPGLETTPVVVLSGLDEDDAGAPRYASGVHAFLTKPVEPAVFVETVRRALARTDA